MKEEQYILCLRLIEKQKEVIGVLHQMLDNVVTVKNVTKQATLMNERYKLCHEMMSLDCKIEDKWEGSG